MPQRLHHWLACYRQRELGLPTGQSHTKQLQLGMQLCRSALPISWPALLPHSKLIFHLSLFPAKKCLLASADP